jgi:nickel-dependent lactate racemase
MSGDNAPLSGRVMSKQRKEIISAATTANLTFILHFKKSPFLHSVFCA